MSAGGMAKPLVGEAITTIPHLPRGLDAVLSCRAAAVSPNLVLRRRGDPPSPQEDRVVLAEAEPRPAGAAGPGAPAQGRDPRGAGSRVRRRHLHSLALCHRDRAAAGRPRPGAGPG